MRILFIRIARWLAQHEPRTNLGGGFGVLRVATKLSIGSPPRKTTLLQRLVRGERPILVGSAMIFVLAAGTFCLMKLAAHGYNALDLAIFSQVIDKTSHGQLFGFGIHPHLYFGDHIDISLLLFVPFWKLLPHAGTLLILQTIILAFGVWPLWSLAKGQRSLFRLGIAWVYLGTVLVHNIAAFEFHTLSLVVPLLLTAALGYTQRRFRLFALALLGTLLVREDMGLVVLGFGILGLAERRSRRWSIPLLLLGTLWFIGGIYATGLFNHDHYKFLAYYSWLGSSVPEIAKNAVLHPWLLAERLFAPQNILFAVASVLLFAGLPLLAWEKLLPALPFAFALFLTGFGGDEITLRTHYMAVFVPFLLWASIEGLQRVRERGLPIGKRLFDHPAALAWLALAATTLYGFFTLSPFGPAGIRSLMKASNDPAVAVENGLTAEIPTNASIAASYAVLPDLANSKELYSLHYAFAGKRQLSSLPYALPEDTEWILYDARDYLAYTAQWNGQEKLTGGDDRLRALLRERNFGLVSFDDSFLLFRRNALGLAALYEVGTEVKGRAVAKQPAANLQLLAIAGQEQRLTTDGQVFDGATRTFLPVTLSWSVVRHDNQPLELRFQLVDSQEHLVYERRYPVAYGLFPTPEWKAGEPVAVRHRFLIPELPKGTYTAQIQAATAKGYLTLDPKLSAKIAITKETLDGKPWVLGTLSL